MSTTTPARIVQTQDQVAEHFGVHRRTVCDWFASGCPGEPGAYDLDAIAKWRTEKAKLQPIRRPRVLPPAIRRLRANGYHFVFSKKTGEICARHQDGREHLVCQLERSEAFPRPTVGRAIAAWLNGDH